MSAIVQCAWCKRVELWSGHWSLHPESLNTFSKVTHGICPACKEAEMAKLETLLVEPKKEDNV
jgi:hypothetical protein